MGPWGAFGAGPGEQAEGLLAKPQRTASTKFNLPLPLGPTMANIDGLKANSVFVAKVV